MQQKLDSREIQDLQVEEMISKIRKDKKSEFVVFLALELRDRFEERPQEEKHLDFEQWKKLLMLRDEIKGGSEKKSFTKGYLYASKANPAKNFRTPLKKNKEYYKDKGVEIPDHVKQMSTSHLLALRYSYYSDLDDEVIYAELANRPHIPNKNERKNESKKRHSSKKDGAKKKAIRSHKSQNGRQYRR
jgi:hypothetical protein